MFQLNGQPISIDNEYTTEDGVTYPHLRDPAVREALGVVEVPDPAPYDQRFYWDHDLPKELDQLKAQWIAQTKNDANAQLTQTDWMIIRKVDRNVEIPDDTAAQRAGIIAAADAKEAAITAATTVEELMAAVGAVPAEAPAPQAPEVIEPELATADVVALSSEQINAL